MKLIIFDCDGTLVDSQHVIVASMDEAFRACDLSPPEDVETRSIIGLSMFEAIDRLRPGLDADRIEQVKLAYRDAFIAHDKDTETMFDGAEDAVRRLAARDDVLLGIATGKSQRGVKRLLDERNLGACFVTIQTADDAPIAPPRATQRYVIMAGTIATVPDEGNGDWRPSTGKGRGIYPSCFWPRSLAQNAMRFSISFSNPRGLGP